MPVSVKASASNFRICILSRPKSPSIAVFIIASRAKSTKLAFYVGRSVSSIITLTEEVLAPNSCIRLSIFLAS